MKKIIPIYTESHAILNADKVNKNTQISFKNLPPLSLYIHIPWCIRKCPYCDFNSHVACTEIPEQAYIQALISDLEQALPNIWGRTIHTIFIGGGTPSLFSAQSYDYLLSKIRMLLPLAVNAEITLEANPGTFESERFRDYRAAGINRLSIGIQSFNPQHLKILGRIHDDAQAHRAIEIAQQYFASINLDLMYGLPEQSFAEGLADIQQALSYQTTHLSFYQLTIEENTAFAKRPPATADEVLLEQIQTSISEQTNAFGYQHYEVSAYAKNNQFAKHNLNYWQFGDYLGIGAGAHSKISLRNRIWRETRANAPHVYMQAVAKGKPVHTHEDIAIDQIPFEFMLNALRLQNGFAPSLFVERTGLAFTMIQTKLSELEKKSLITLSPQSIQTTSLGKRFLNDLIAAFLDA